MAPTLIEAAVSHSLAIGAFSFVNQRLPIMNLSSVLNYPAHAGRSESLAGTHMAAFFQYWKLLVFVPLVFALLAAGVSALVPDVYKAQTKVLLRQLNQTNAAAMLSQANSLAGASGNAMNIRIPIDPNVKLPSDIYVALLKSNSVMDALSQKFLLGKRYEVAGTEKIRKILSKNTAIKITREGLIDIAVEDSDPKQAALLANAYVEELHTVIQKLGLTNSSQRRLFFEQKLQSSQDKIIEAQALLQNIPAEQETAARDQALAKMDAAASLEARISFKELQLSAGQAFFTADNAENDRAHQELQAMRAKLAEFDINNDALKLRYLQKPEQNLASRESAKSFYDLKYHQALTQLLEKEYQMASRDEAKDASSALKVIDPAAPPENPHYPNRPIIVFLAVVTGLFLAILAILFLISFPSKKEQITG